MSRAGHWRLNSRCRACGYRMLGDYSRFDTLCPGCGAQSRWAWQLWAAVRERPVGWLGSRWEEIKDGEPFELDEAQSRGRFIA